MKYKYHGYFYLSRDKRKCYVNVPALELEFEIQQANMMRFGLIRTAVKEVGLDVYLRELDGEGIPPDRAVADEEERSTFSAVLDIDTGKVSRTVSIVKEFDIK